VNIVSDNFEVYIANLVNKNPCNFYVIFFFLFDNTCIWFSFQGQLLMNLEHDIFFNGAIETSQGYPFHVVDCTNVCNGEIRVGSGSVGVALKQNVSLYIK
jgi:hypothetical protein